MTQFRDNLHVTNVASSDQQGDFLGSQSEMPAPSVYNAGCTVYYTGVAGTYNPGQFYTCVQDGATYKWEAANVISTGFRQGTADRALMTDASGYAVASGVTGTELGYLSGVTGGIQGQLNRKVPVSRKINGKTLENDITLGYADVGAAPVAGTLDVNRALQSNGSGEVTVSNVTAVELSYLSGVTSAIQTQLNGKADIDDVPTLLSELTNDTGFITNAVTDLVNYYVKGDTYTKAEVNNLVSAIPKFSIQVVASLPSSNISTTTIYLTPSGGAAGNVYNEFIYVNNAWEQIGSTAVDLSDYYDKATVNTMVTPVQSASGITINGVALQAATTGRQGLMTASQVSNLSTAMTNAQNALNGNVTGGTLSTDASGNMTLTLNRGAGALNISANGITAAKAIADGNGANIASTYATIGALNSGLAGKANANTAITGGAFSLSGSSLGLTLNRGAGNISVPAVTLPTGGANSVNVSTSGNNMTVNVDGHSDTDTIINSLSASVSGSNLTINVNGRSATADISQSVESIVQVMGFGQYITSGFDQYEGHSAIGFGKSRASTTYNNLPCIGIGVVSNEEVVGILHITSVIVSGSVRMDRDTTAHINSCGMIVF